jgi:hypothetical protein
MVPEKSRDDYMFGDLHIVRFIVLVLIFVISIIFLISILIMMSYDCFGFLNLFLVLLIPCLYILIVSMGHPLFKIANDALVDSF